MTKQDWNKKFTLLTLTFDGIDCLVSRDVNLIFKSNNADKIIRWVISQSEREFKSCLQQDAIALRGAREGRGGGQGAPPADETSHGVEQKQQDSVYRQVSHQADDVACRQAELGQSNGEYYVPLHSTPLHSTQLGQGVAGEPAQPSPVIHAPVNQVDEILDQYYRNVHDLLEFVKSSVLSLNRQEITYYFMQIDQLINDISRLTLHKNYNFNFPCLQ